MGEMTGVYRVLIGKLEGKGPLERLRQRWEGKTKRIIRNWDGQAWTGLIWLKIRTGKWSIVNAVINLQVP
jgi:hypothetical protein